MSSPPWAKPDSSAAARTPSSTWTWSFPGAPISINLPLNLITRLQLAIANQITPRAEVGGLLLGSPGKTPGTVEIYDFVWISSTTQADGEYHLNTQELERLRRQNTGYGFDRNGARQFPVIGYFRTQLQGALELREREVDLIKERFLEPSNVALLIQTHENIAGFFCWYGDIFTPFSFRDFPFDAASLRPDIAQPASEPPLIEPAEVVRTVTNWAENHSRSPQTFLAIAAFVLALVGLSWFLLQDRRPPPRSTFTPQQIQSAPAAVAGVPVKLEVETQGNGLNIRWNPQGTLVTRATEGRLVILTKGQEPDIVVLDTEQLATGHVYYQSAAKQLGLRLELVDNSGKVATESVLALSSSKPETGLTEAQARIEPSKTGPERVRKKVSTERAANRSRPVPADTASSERASVVPIQHLQRPSPTKKVGPILEAWVADLIPANQPSQIIVTMYVDVTGRVIRAEPLRHEVGVNRRLEQTAVAAAMQWQFEPARLNDKPVPGEYTVRFEFRN